MAHLDALERFAQARRTTQIHQDHSISILEDEITRLVSAQDARLELHAQLEKEIVALTAVVESKNKQMKYIWEEVDSLARELHPGGFWERQPEEYEEDEEADNREGEKKSGEEETVPPVVEDKSVVKEKEGMEMGDDGAKGVVVEVPKEVGKKEEQLEAKMRWGWNLGSYQFRSRPKRVVNWHGPLPYLERLPSEIHDMILLYLTGTEKTILARVSSDLLEIVARVLYRNPRMKAPTAYLFAKSRLSPPTEYNWIRATLTPTVLRLVPSRNRGTSYLPQHYNPLFGALLRRSLLYEKPPPSSPSPTPPSPSGISINPSSPASSNNPLSSIPLPPAQTINVSQVSIEGGQDPDRDIEFWSPFLQMLDPFQLQINNRADRATMVLPPTLRTVPTLLVSFTKTWTRLRSVFLCGPGTVWVEKVESEEEGTGLDATRTRLVWDECLERCVDEGMGTKLDEYTLETSFVGNVKETVLELVPRDQLVGRLSASPSEAEKDVSCVFLIVQSDKSS
ncbi:hypothetical protein BDY24DRAFT_96120 [Mrakia frigida]|uniref:uncharacterized protein n=1 Tax=Mrakia frigida TaxID=29902 RepID=UPI003FCC2459